MAVLLPVQYRSKKYPPGIEPVLTEIPGHFGVQSINPQGRYSLHTEYSKGRRDFKSPALAGLNAILLAKTGGGQPHLWAGPEWVREFGEFLVRLCSGHRPPDIIEIHPPVVKICPNLEAFIKLYKPFERAMAKVFPGTMIAIENRNKPGRFVLKKRDSLLELSRIIDRDGLALRLCLDVPQLFTAHYDPAPRTLEEIDHVLLPLMACRHNIASLHLYGRRKASHMGTLDSWLENSTLKNHLLQRLFELLNDEKPRWFVPEVNSSKSDFEQIVEDIRPALARPSPAFP